jgi:sugar phosphate isomerase/epimerase
MRALILCDDCRPGKVAEICRSHQCGIEVQSFYDTAYFDREPDAVANHRDLLRDISVRSLHGPFPDLNPGSTDRMLQLVTANRYQMGVNVARQLNINHIILHHGYVPGTYKPNTWVKRFSAFWKEFLADQPQAVSFHIENLFDRDPGLIADAIAAVDDERIDVCLDVGHAHCFSSVSVSAWVRRLGDRIGYVHLHNNHGEADEHLDLDKGTIDMAEVCSELEDVSSRALWALESSVDSHERMLTWLYDRGFHQANETR